MSLVVNTNVSSLTAQRALAYADSLQGEAMTRLSTGSKINSAADDAAGLAMAQRMTAQVTGINMAVKNPCSRVLTLRYLSEGPGVLSEYLTFVSISSLKFCSL